MGTAHEFEREKLFCGVLYTDENDYVRACERLRERFGAIDLESDPLSFSAFSDYYGYEMTGEVYRRFVSFEVFAAPDTIADIKTWTNEVEADMSVDGKRRVNLDPGLIGHGRLLLPTTKPAGHRIALRDGIYIEMTLFYSRGGWHEFPWTYRDFKSEEVQGIMTQIRKKYIKTRRETMKNKNNTEADDVGTD